MTDINADPPATEQKFTIEAEDMHRTNFHTVDGDQASGGELVRMGGCDTDGTLKTDFEGPGAVYDLTVRAQDESDGASKIKVLVDGKVVGEIILDQNDDGRGSNNGGFSDFTLEGIEIPEGASIELQAWRDGGEFVRIDSIDLEKVGELKDEVCLLEETFSSGYDLTNSDNIVESDFIGWYGRAVTNGTNDGELVFRAIDTGQFEHVELSLDIKLASGSFEASGRAADFFRIEVITEDGVILLDEFRGNGTTLIGSETGQVINPGLDSISYELPDGIDSTQVRIVSSISARSEVLKFDNVKVTGTPIEQEPPEGQVCIDFDMSADGTPLMAGDNGELVFDGVTFTAIRSQDTDGALDDAMIFDAANPTGGDTDLFQPASGNVLIISEDGDASDPDDNAAGGVIVAELDQPSTVNSIDILDTETANGGQVELFGADGALLASFDIPQIRNGGIQTLDLGDTENVQTVKVTFTSSGAIDSFKFVPPEAPLPGALSGTYFCDDDDDGTDDGAAAGDSDIAGLTVSLFLADGMTRVTDIAGNIVEPVLTDEFGDYRFDNLAAGDYVVMFAEAPGKRFIAANVGDDDSVDSDVLGANGQTAPVTVLAGEETMNVDAGVEVSDPLTGQIGDTVWLDIFGDGILNDEAFDPGFQGVEQGVDGVTVQLKDAATGDVLEEQVTGNGGQYLFTGLAGGAYIVGFVLPDGFGFTARDAGGDDARDSDADRATGMTDVITLEPGGSVLTVDAGLLRSGLIEGTSQADENSPVGGNDLLVGSETDDIIIGFSGVDTLIGNGGNDQLEGDSFDDILDGGAGNDDLNGDDENDILIGGVGNDDLDGGRDFDIAVFSGNFADYAFTIGDLFTGEITVTGPDGEDRLRNIETLRFDDGDVAIDTIVPGGARDTATAPAAVGDAVNIDVLANDVELSEGTLEVAQTSDGAFGTVNIEADGTVTYTAGSDFQGYDFFNYTVSNGLGFVNTVEVQVGDLPRPDPDDPNVIVLQDFTGVDGDSINGTNGADIILGGIGFDRISGQAGEDLIDGGKGDDFIVGNFSDDTLLGGDGDDFFNGDNGTDRIFGEVGRDLIVGSIQDDVLFGGDGNDRLQGQNGSDFLSGGTGDDDFSVFGDGADIAFGGAGDDDFLWQETDGAERDLLDGESGTDTLTISLEAGTDALAVQAEIDAYLATVSEPPAGSINDGSVLSDTFSFTTIGLDVSNIENILLV